MNFSQVFVSTEKRIEIKEIFKPSYLSKLEVAIHLSRFGLRKVFPTRRVNSVYFDSFAFDALMDSMEGNSLRKKYRLRWYGKAKDETKAVLEIKKKRGHLSWKDLNKNSFMVTPRAKSWDEFIQAKNGCLGLEKLMPTLEPKSIISYDRAYFGSIDRKVRVTLDQNLTSFQQISQFSPNLSHRRCHLGFIVLEIKVSNENKVLLNEIIKDLPFSPKRFSKYCESLVPQKYF